MHFTKVIVKTAVCLSGDNCPWVEWLYRDISLPKDSLKSCIWMLIKITIKLSIKETPSLHNFKRPLKFLVCLFAFLPLRHKIEPSVTLRFNYLTEKNSFENLSLWCQRIAWYRSTFYYFMSQSYKPKFDPKDEICLEFSRCCFTLIRL